MQLFESQEAGASSLVRLALIALLLIINFFSPKRMPYLNSAATRQTFGAELSTLERQLSSFLPLVSCIGAMPAYFGGHRRR